MEKKYKNFKNSKRHKNNSSILKLLKSYFQKSKSSSNLLKYEQISYEFRESFILSGYRIPNSSFKTCLKSIFSFDSNETINFWTHFMPFLYSFYTLVKLYFVYDIVNDHFVWPLAIYLTTICFYLLMSSVAHALNCMSPIARHVCFILDYLSISIYGMGCSIAYKAYTLSTIEITSKETFFDYYVLLALGFSLFANIMSSGSRFIVSHGKRTLLRSISFITQYVFINLPLFYRFLYFYFPSVLQELRFMFSFLSSTDTHILVNPKQNDSWLKNESDCFYLMQFCAAILSAILYIVHIPERIWPGKFDIIGQSHQIFHLTSFMCTWSQFTAVKSDMKSIMSNSANSLIEWKHFGFSTLPYFNEIRLSYSSIMFYCLILNSLILFYYYLKAVYFNPWKTHNELNYFTNCSGCSNLRRKNLTKIKII